MNVVSKWSQRLLAAWRKLRSDRQYITIHDNGRISVDPRRYFESENGQRQIRALRELDV